MGESIEGRADATLEPETPVASSILFLNLSHTIYCARPCTLQRLPTEMGLVLPAWS